MKSVTGFECDVYSKTLASKTSLEDCCCLHAAMKAEVHILYMVCVAGRLLGVFHLHLQPDTGSCRLYSYMQCIKKLMQLSSFVVHILLCTLCHNDSAENPPEDSHCVPMKHNFFIECKRMLILHVFIL